MKKSELKKFKEWLMNLCYTHKFNPYIETATEGHELPSCPVCIEFRKCR